MNNTIEDKLSKTPILKQIFCVMKRVKIPFLEDMSLYTFIKLYIKGIVDGALTNRAGSVAFSFFMALFPMALFLLNLIPYIPIENFQSQFMSFVEQSVPPTTYGAVEMILLDILNNSYSSLLSTGVILSIILMANGINALFTGFEFSYHINQTRNYFKQYLISIVLSVVLSLFFILSLAVFISMEVLMHISKYPFIAKAIRSTFVLSLVLIMISGVYKMGTKETKKMAFISVGSVTATLLFALTSYGFGIYVTHFAKYNELYGSIGTLLVIMIYIWINCMILLLGFDLNALILRYKTQKIKQKNN